MASKSQILIWMSLLCSLACSPVWAARNYDNCTGFIDSVPAVISTQGIWCLRKDLATSVGGTVIQVSTANVTIDCNDFKLGGLAAGVDTTAWGIVAVNQANLTVRNCNIRGFYLGIRASDGSLIENNRFDYSRYSAIVAAGRGITVRDNRIYATGDGSSSFVTAILADGSVDVIDNTVSGVKDYGFIMAIYGASNRGTISGNRISGVVNESPDAAYGIYHDGNVRGSIRGNLIRTENGASGVAIKCQQLSVIARDNIEIGYTSTFTGCTDGGGNVTSF